MSDRVGQQVGNYRLEQLLGSGGFADVYLGKHVFLDSPAAIKLLHTNLAQGDIEGFRSEALTLVRLIHPHIVRILDFGLEGNIPFLVMDYAPNGTLRQRYRRGERPPLTTVVKYVNQIASALQYAHDQKVIHRDVKPENMLLGRQQEILLSDFGIAIVAQSTQAEMTQETTGTIAYMAPEQIQAHPRAASDQYALGIVAYEWLTGYPPFSGAFTEIAVKHIMVSPPSLREKVPTIPPEVEQVVLTAIAKDPKQRFGSVRAFATALEQASRGMQLDLPALTQTQDSLTQTATAVASPATPILPLMPPDAHNTPASLHAADPGADTILETPDGPVPADPQAYAPTIITPSAQPRNPVSLPPPVQSEPEAERKGISRRTLLIGGAVAVGVVAAGGITLALTTHSSPGNAGQTTGQTPVAKKTTTATTSSPTTALILAQDNFHRPNHVLWGTSSDGHLWGGDANALTDFSIFNDMGQIQRTAAHATLYTAVLGNTHTDAEVIATAILENFNPSHIGVILRWQDDNHYYKAYIDGSILHILKRDNTSGPTLASVHFPAQANTPYTIRFRVIGTTLRAKAWQANTAEPAGWMVTATDHRFQSGLGGFRPQLDQNVTLQVAMFQEQAV